jgi:hypothetical protein
MEARWKNLTDAWPGKATGEKNLSETPLFRNAAALKHQAWAGRAIHVQLAILRHACS